MFWERLWRMSGINFVVFFIVAYLIYPSQPQVGAPADALVAFFTGDRTRILIAAVVAGLAVLNLMWFAAALRATRRVRRPAGRRPLTKRTAPATRLDIVMHPLPLLLIGCESSRQGC